MDRNELLKMLDLKARVKEPEATEDLSVRHEAPQTADLQDTFLVLDEWDRAQGESLYYKGGRHELEELDYADLYACTFLFTPERTAGCEDRLRHHFMELLLDSPEYQVLHHGTRGNTLASELATQQLAERLSEYKEECRENGSADETGSGSGLPGKVDNTLLSAVVEGVAEAQQVVDELTGTCEALGCGPGLGGNDKLNAARVARIFHRVRNNKRLRDICDRAGKFIRTAQSKQRHKTVHGRDDMVGVELGGDVSRLTSQELMQLADEDLELDAMRRLLENQSQCRQYKGAEPVGKGPILVCVDESGSMHGDPICNAKAFALSMVWIARQQKRWCGLVGYSGGTEGNLLVIKPGQENEEQLMDWLEHFYSGGTDADVPLEQLPGRYWREMGAPRGKTDLILITDALMHVPWEMGNKFLEWKKQEQVRCISLVLAGAAGGLERMSDEVHLLRTIDAGESAVQTCLSI